MNWKGLERTQLWPNLSYKTLAFAWRAGNKVLTWLHSQSDNHVPSHQGADLLPCSGLLLVALLEQLLVHVA